MYTYLSRHLLPKMTSTLNRKFGYNLLRFRSMMLNELNDIYGNTLKRSQEKILEVFKEKSELIKQSSLAQKIKVAKGFYQVEMSPPKLDEMKKIQEDLDLVKEFIKTGCFKYLTIKQAWLLFLVGSEVILWFFLGETIGKMHIVGYKV